MEEKKEPKAHGYWNNEERVLEEAKKYTVKTKFAKQSSGAYESARKNGWLEKCCEHMKSFSKPMNYWTKEVVLEEALKYTTRGQFKENSKGAYTKAVAEKWLDEVCMHMEYKIPWTKELIMEEAVKYKELIDFRTNATNVYNAAYNRGILDEVCSHMSRALNPNNYWTKDRVTEEALKYETKKDFRKYSAGAYNAANKNGWHKEVCTHMKLMGNRKNRFVYKATFSDGKIYIGLTYSLKERTKSHLSSKKKSSIYKYVQEYGEEPMFELISELLPIEEAAKLETDRIKYFRNLLGRENVLNIKDGGGLGGNVLIYSFEVVKTEALKYATKKDFRVNSRGFYAAMLRNKWTDELTQHMICGRISNCGEIKNPHQINDKGLSKG